jgi:hypothetical protein
MELTVHDRTPDSDGLDRTGAKRGVKFHVATRYWLIRLTYHDVPYCLLTGTWRLQTQTARGGAQTLSEKMKRRTAWLQPNTVARTGGIGWLLRGSVAFVDWRCHWHIVLLMCGRMTIISVVLLTFSFATCLKNTCNKVLILRGRNCVEISFL